MSILNKAKYYNVVENMKKKINIVTIDTPPLTQNPYTIFIVDSLMNRYDISYWSTTYNEKYGTVKFQKVGNALSVILKKTLYLILLIYYWIGKWLSHNIDNLTLKEFAWYVSSTIVDNIFLFFALCLKTNKTEIFIAVNAGGLLALSWLKKCKKYKFAYCIYEVYPFQFFVKSKKMRDWRCLIERVGVKNCDILIDTGENKISAFLRRIYKLRVKSTANLLIVPPKIISCSRAITEYPIKFYYHGAYVPNRGLKNLIYAMKGIDVDKGLLYLRGIGDYQSELEQIVKDLNLQNQVFFLEPVNTVELSRAASYFDVGCTMVEMDIVNHKFAVGFKTYENINAGLAIIAPNSFNLNPFIIKNKVGMMYSDSTVNELSRVLNNYINDLRFVDACKQESRNCAENIIKREIQIDKLEKIIIALYS